MCFVGQIRKCLVFYLVVTLLTKSFKFDIFFKKNIKNEFESTAITLILFQRRTLPATRQCRLWYRTVLHIITEAPPDFFSFWRRQSEMPNRIMLSGKVSLEGYTLVHKALFFLFRNANSLLKHMPLCVFIWKFVRHSRHRCATYVQLAVATYGRSN